MANENLKQQTKRGLYWQFLNQFSNYGIQFIIGIFMARLLSPEDYGITALPAVFMAVAGVFIEGGFGDALVRKPELKEEDLSTAFFYAMSVGILCYIIIFFSSPWIADFYNTPVLEKIMRITALTFLWGPLGTPQGVLLKRKLNFKTPTKIGIICKIFSGIVGISLALTGFGLWALVISGLFSGILGLSLTWYVVRWYPKTGWSKTSFKYLWGYGNKIIGSYLIGNIYENIAPVIIGKYMSPFDLGIFNRAQNYASMPSKNLTGTIQSVSFPVISKIQDDEVTLALTYRKLLRSTAFVVFPTMMLLSALSRPLVITMVTIKWEACIILLQIMCFSMMWYPIHAINLNLLMVKGRTDLFFRLEMIKRGMGLLILIITLPIGLVAFCLGGLVGSIFSLIVNTYYTGKLIHCGFIRQIKELTHILLLSGIMFSAIIFVNQFIENYIVQLVVGVIIGGVIYIGGAITFHFSELNEVKYMLRK